MVLMIKNINKYIDYIQDPNDTFEEYLKKAKEYVSANVLGASAALDIIEGEICTSS